MVYTPYSAARAVLTTVLPHLHECQINTCVADVHGVMLCVTVTSPTALCPLCGAPSSSVPSRSTRTLPDLSIGERCVRLHLQVRRFVCHHGPACGRFSANVFAPSPHRIDGKRMTSTPHSTS
jgi:hypothetical protein